MTSTEREKLIQQYADGPQRLRTALAKVPQEALKWRPAPGEWSAHEVVWHCADAEANAHTRIRFLAAETEPVVQAYDQDLWARTFDYHALPLEPALATVDSVRATTAALIRTFGDAVWAKKGRHTESGPYSAEGWLQIYANHPEIHARQIENNLATWQTTPR